LIYYYKPHANNGSKLCRVENALWFSPFPDRNGGVIHEHQELDARRKTEVLRCSKRQVLLTISEPLLIVISKIRLDDLESTDKIWGSQGQSIRLAINNRSDHDDSGESLITIKNYLLDIQTFNQIVNHLWQVDQGWSLQPQRRVGFSHCKKLSNARLTLISVLKVRKY